MIAKLVDIDNNIRVWSLLSLTVISFFTVIFFLPAWLIFTPLIFITVLIYTNIKYAEKYSDRIEKSLDITLMENNFVADDSYLSDDYLSGIAINELENKIAILKRSNINENFKLSQFNFKDIIECSVIEDGETLTKVSKGSIIGSSIVGSVVAGSAGMIVGGLSANKHSKEQIVKATLSIIVDDLVNPIRNVHFLNSKMLIDKNSDLYQNIHEDMNKWYKRLCVIIRRNEKK